MYSTFYLFKKVGSFWLGFMSAFNLSGKNFDYNYSDSPLESDNKAIKNDWGVVGADLWKARFK